MNKFKAGDIVIPNSGAFEGTECRINKHIHDGHYIVESLSPHESRGHQAGGTFDTQRGWGYYEKDLELAEPVESKVESKPEAKFKLGDKIIPNCYPFYDTPCEVIQNLDYEGDYRIKSLRLNEGRGNLGDDKAYVSFTKLENATLVTEQTKSELELAKEEPVQACKFKVGDRVTYVGDTYKLKEQLATVVATKDSHPGWFDKYTIDSIIEFDKESINTHYCIIDGFEFTPSGKGYFAKRNEIVLATYTEEELVKPKEWIPATKLIDSKTDVNLSPELEYHQEPQIIKKPIKKSLITI
jgi:hypothetical protein